MFYAAKNRLLGREDNVFVLTPRNPHKKRTRSKVNVIFFTGVHQNELQTLIPSVCSLFTNDSSRPKNDSKVRKEHPGLAVGPMQKILSEMWKALEEDDVARYAKVCVYHAP